MLSKFNLCLFLAFYSCFLFAQQKVDLKAYKIIEKNMALISAAVAPEGGGSAEYEKYLHDNYSRWMMDEKELVEKEEFLQSVEGWFSEGWRVVEKKQSNYSIYWAKEFAFVRRIVEEFYEGPDGEKSSSKSALSETWRLEGSDWLLLRVDIKVL